MRNYLSLWLTQTHVTFSPVPVQAQSWCWGRDEAEMIANTQPVIDLYVANGISYEIVSSGRAFVLLDKAQLFGLIQDAGSHGIAPSIYQLDDTPRDTWKPSRDDPAVNPGTGTAADATNHVPRPKAGDFSGAGGLYQFFLSLALYASTLKAAGRVRDGEIVQFAYDQVSKLVWTITQAFDYLRENHLL